MLKFKDILTIGIAVLIASCSGDDITAGGSLEGKDYDPVGTPVQFSVGIEGKATTRAIMADGGHFVCSMYCKALEEGDYNTEPPANGGTMKTAWLQIYGSGNAKYMDQDNHLRIDKLIDDGCTGHIGEQIHCRKPVVIDFAYGHE